MICQESRRSLGCLGVGRWVSLEGSLGVVGDEIRLQLFVPCLLQDARAALASLSGDALAEEQKKDLILEKCSLNLLRSCLTRQESTAGDDVELPVGL